MSRKLGSVDDIKIIIVTALKTVQTPMLISIQKLPASLLRYICREFKFGEIGDPCYASAPNRRGIKR